jgi:hypothetical protein
MKAVSGLDVYKDTIFACILQKGIVPFVKEYSTLTCGARELSDYLQALGVNMVAAKFCLNDHIYPV